MVFQCDPMDFISWYNPSQAYTVKHVSYPQLTATPLAGLVYFNLILCGSIDLVMLGYS